MDSNEDNEDIDLSSPDVRCRLRHLTKSGYHRVEFTNVFQFKVALADIEWSVWRRFQVPATYTLWDLFVAINDAFGWSSDGFFSFAFIHSGEHTAATVVAKFP